MPKAITNINKTTFSSTAEAFEALISRPKWYKGILIDSKEISNSNAGQIKYRFGKNKVTVDLMEQLLLAAGYNVLQEKIWGK